ncbi:protein of unknown function [Variovorax sp. YR266]|uniref:DUF4123 domain-containing protein n=1 Tax=Variovorax sp. YR266 TaxID=1884386 RepID=UPI00089BC532|nr:DUF4123 domain-containing protein [Variovorax sp. YR266]SDZ72380.1 protein of unknown function [Variovorax sp. YR266]
MTRLKTSLIHIEDHEQFAAIIGAHREGRYILLDPSDATRYEVIKEVGSSHSRCLFDGDEKEAAGLSAPYLLDWDAIRPSNRKEIVAYLSAGHGVVLISGMPPDHLKRRLKVLLHPKGNYAQFNKYYTAISLSFFLESEERFSELLDHASKIYCRNFRERHDFIVYEAE